jgi:hypothetical protein
MGVSYKGGVQSYHGITDNLTGLKSSFKYKNGYFGDKGTSSQVRVIYGNDPVNIGKDFYKKISFGGIEKDLDNGKGKITYMADGSIITFRPITKSDNYPAVNINISRSTDSGGIKTQKIHFGKEDEKK